MKKTIIYALLGGVLFASPIVIRLASQTGPRVAPFTARGVTVFYKPSGEIAGTRPFIYASRADGSSVQVDTHVTKDARVYTTRTVTDLRHAALLGVNDLVGAYFRESLTPGTVRLGQGRLSACRGGSFTERQVLLGIETVHVFTRTPPVKDTSGDLVYFTNDDRQAPELECYPMKRTGTFFRNGTTTRTLVQVTELTIGEPDPRLFDPPASSYSQRDRREVKEAYRQALQLSGHVGACLKRTPTRNAE